MAVVNGAVRGLSMTKGIRLLALPSVRALAGVESGVSKRTQLAVQYELKVGRATPSTT
jgi:hypothetical protein